MECVLLEMVDGKATFVKEMNELKKGKEENIKKLCSKALLKNSSFCSFLSNDGTDNKRGERKISKDLLPGYYCIWCILKNPEWKRSKDDFEAFSKFFKEPEKVLSYLEEEYDKKFPESKPKTPNLGLDVEIESSDEDRQNIAQEPESVRSAVESNENIGIEESENIKWAEDWWTRHLRDLGEMKYRVTKYEDYILAEVYYEEEPMDLLAVVNYPEKIIIIPFLDMKKEIEYIDENKDVDLAIVIHTNEEKRKKKDYKEYQFLDTAVLEICVNKRTRDTNKVISVWNPRDCYHEFILEIPIDKELKDYRAEDKQIISQKNLFS